MYNPTPLSKKSKININKLESSSNNKINYSGATNKSTHTNFNMLSSVKGNGGLKVKRQSETNVNEFTLEAT